MKKMFWVLTILMTSLNALALEADFTTYMRGGTGVNQEGGKMECFRNSGLPGNFMRLGNECDFYTELGFVFHNKKATADDASFFRTQLRYAYSSEGLRQWESNRTTVTSTPATITTPKSEIEAYVKAGGIDGMPMEYWVGKRFYRDVDMYIWDWYYYAEMAGVGAGIEQIPLGTGKLAIANLIQANEEFNTTSIGRPVLNIWDVRYSTIPVFAEQNISFWGVYAWAKASDNGATQHFDSTNGYVLATKLEGKVGPGYNKFVVEYGQGAMKDFNVYGSSTVDTAEADQMAQNKAWNVRIVEDWHMDVTEKWGVFFGVAASQGSTGADTDNKVQWQAIGVRPVYNFTDRFQLATEFGFSRYENESEKVGGVAVGVRELGRVAIAPQLSIGKSIWGRPVLRAYAAYSFWNDANKGSSYIGSSAPTFADKSSGLNVGYQFEAWF
ncbi:carbohydrate porin [Bdellovibrio sp. HCB209]|uniref:carbohydrate porin n=1 Tax=Bdellovibrio sp. HCB209 TaxID=3394354 RepID=UPI0039B3F18D